VNPRDDVDFVALVDHLAAVAPGPRELEDRLRPTHPAVVVRASGLADEPIEVWYVNRDGSWTGPRTDGEMA
jgi:hypothetical protein